MHGSFDRVMKHAVRPEIVSRMGPRELSTTIWAAAKVLGTSPLATPTSWLEPLLGQMVLIIPRFKPQDCSMCLWSLATLTQAWGVHGESLRGERDARALTARVIDALIQSSGANMDSFGAQSISNTLWALSKLGRKPSELWMRAGENRLVAVMHELTPQALANTSWSFVLLEHVPSASWQSSFLTNTRMALFESSSLAASSSLIGPSAVVAWSVARLGLQVDNAWMEGLSSSVYSCLSAPPGIHLSTTNLSLDLANILWAMATLSYRPRPQVVSTILSQCIVNISSISPNELCSLIWSIGKIKYVPSGREWRLLSDAVASLCPSCSGQGLCNIIWSVATLRLTPGREWLREILTTLRLKMDDCGPQELANLW